MRGGYGSGVSVRRAAAFGNAPLCLTLDSPREDINRVPHVAPVLAPERSVTGPGLCLPVSRSECYHCARRWPAIPKQPRFDKHSAGTPGKRPPAPSVKVRQGRKPRQCAGISAVAPSSSGTSVPSWWRTNARPLIRRD
jgi:hypothetical protein